MAASLSRCGVAVEPPGPTGGPSARRRRAVAPMVEEGSRMTSTAIDQSHLFFNLDQHLQEDEPDVLWTVIRLSSHLSS